jgi:two-component system chemotaxis sensor kinase CheA
MDLSEYHDLFLQEAEGYLTVLRVTLQRLYSQPEDVQALGEAHRASHSLKSISATMNYQEPRAVATEMEAILYKAHMGIAPLTQPIIALMANTCDKLDTIIHALQPPGWTPAPRAPIEEVEPEPERRGLDDEFGWDLGAGPAPGPRR